MGTFLDGVLQKLLDHTNNSMFAVPDKSKVTVDLHSHLLPGVDDGVKTMDEAVDIVWKLKLLGYEKLITTPHIMSQRYPNVSRDLKIAHLKLLEALKRRQIEMDVQLAAEYYFDDHFLDLIAWKDILTFGDHYVLFETSYSVRPSDLEKGIHALRKNGYTPVLAHPERYLYMQDDLGTHRWLKTMGVLYQMNINSLGGYYGSGARKCASMLIAEGMVDFIGSDVHSMKHVRKLSDSLNSKEYVKLFKNNKIRNNQL